VIRWPARPGGCQKKNAKALEGKVAIVSGGNSGIGKAVALALARAGASIVIDYIAHPEATEALEREIAALGDAASAVLDNLQSTHQ
jgi:NAD(P)-dependent dehydrogenase (short-subunit alcohol dehydrogenase family)